MSEADRPRPRLSRRRDWDARAPTPAPESGAAVPERTGRTRAEGAPGPGGQWAGGAGRDADEAAGDGAAGG